MRWTMCSDVSRCNPDSFVPPMEGTRPLETNPVASSPWRRCPSLLAIIALLATSMDASAGEPGLEKIARDYAASHAFHGAILVERHGSTLLHESFGLADREFDIPVQRDTKFRIASVTKAFTAVLILQLRDQGRVDLDATFETYLTGYRGPNADKITIRQLLNHTSGLANYDTSLTYAEAERKGLKLYQLPHKPDQILDELSLAQPAHAPGEVFDYNNFDYVILGKVIEAITRRPYGDVLHDRILSPLAMAETGMLRHEKITKKLARTYWRPKGNDEMGNDWPMYPENWYAAGGMYSTAADLRTFADALFSGKLLKPDSLASMLNPGLDDYGLGVWVKGRYVGGKPDKVFERYGSILGANCLVSHALGADVTVILLSNSNATDLGQFSIQLGDAAALSAGN